LNLRGFNTDPIVRAKDRVLARPEPIQIPQFDSVDERRGLKEHCGVIGIYSLRKEPIAERIVKGLAALQHRGQESWGLATPNEPIIKGLGLIGVGAAANAGRFCVWRVTEGSAIFAILHGDEQTSRMLTHWIFMESSR